MRSTTSSRAGARALAQDAAVGEWLDGEIAAGKGSDPSDHSLHVRHHRHSRRAWCCRRKGCIDAATDTVAFDKLDARDEALAYLPLAWVGDHYLNYAQGLVAGFCLACPENAETAMQDLQGDRPDVFISRRRACSSKCSRAS